MPTAETTRARGQRPEHAPKNDEMEITEPPEPENMLDADNEDHGTYGNDVDVTMEEADKLLPHRHVGEATVLENSSSQRHGCVEQKKGVAIRDDGGTITGHTELWRCQCGVKFQGRNSAATEELYINHLRKFDPDVPRPRSAR